MAQAFSYTTVEMESSSGEVLQRLEEAVQPILDDAGGTLYASWTPVEFPRTAPFVGLGKRQLVVMAAWPDKERAQALDAPLRALDGVTAVTTETLAPIYLADGLNVPTGPGFYVHREELYRPSDVDEAVRLSREAWKTFEPTFGVRVIGLFREGSSTSEVTRLLRIVWYGSFEDWTASRQFTRDPESRRRFRARAQLQVEGSGQALASDRAVR